MTSRSDACAFCEQPIPLGMNSYREVRGWTQDRREGGVHALTLREDTGRVACAPCVAKVKAGVSIDQLELGGAA